MDCKATQIRENDYACEYKKLEYNSMPNEVKLRASSKSLRKRGISKASSLKLNKTVSYKDNKESEFELDSMLRTKSKDPSSANLELINHGPEADLIGYIDPLGVFRLNVHSIGIDLLNSSLTEDRGFFDKLSFESSLKDWHSATKKSFTILKKIFKWMVFSKKSKRYRLVNAKLLNWKYFDEKVDYVMDDQDLT